MIPSWTSSTCDTGHRSSVLFAQSAPALLHSVRGTVAPVVAEREPGHTVAMTTRPGAPPAACLSGVVYCT
jgi:hypothetical protein